MTLMRVFIALISLLVSTSATSTSPLLVAVQHNDVAAAGDLVARGADVNEADEKTGGTPLHRAAFLGAREVLFKLIELGATVDAADGGGNTPLLWAAAQGREECAATLIVAGADLEARDADGDTALIKAAVFGHEAVVRLLLSAGADPAVKNNAGWDALSHAQMFKKDAVEAALNEVLAPRAGGADVQADGGGAADAGAQEERADLEL
jgi:ankyrin repeat protein